MSTVLHIDSIDTAALRRVIVAHRHAVQRDGMASIPRTDGDRRPYVGLSGPERWSVVTLRLSNQGAAEVLAAIPDPRFAELEALEAQFDADGGRGAGLADRIDALRAELAAA